MPQSSMPKIIATPRQLAPAMTKRLAAQYDLRQPAGAAIASLDEMAALSAGAEALIATAFDQMDAAFLEALAPSVKLIASIGVGTDHIDLTAAHSRGITIANTPEVTTPCLADTTLGLIIATCRRFRDGLEIAKTGEGRGMLTPDSWGLRVSGRTLGIIGMGNMGKAVAKRARAFDMNILYTTPRPSAALDEETGGKNMSLDILLQEADIVSLHCPFKEETHHLIDEAAIEKMKPNAVIINISRGPIIDELALIKALKSGRLFAAGLDVFETEPGPIREELRSLSNVYPLPHIASATWESRKAMTDRTLDNIDAFFETGAPLDRVT